MMFIKNKTDKVALLIFFFFLKSFIKLKHDYRVTSVRASEV